MYISAPKPPGFFQALCELSLMISLQRGILDSDSFKSEPNKLSIKTPPCEVNVEASFFWASWVKLVELKLS
jgi:hypothetical protein